MEKRTILLQNIQLIKDRIAYAKKEQKRAKRIIEIMEQDILNHTSILAYTEAELERENESI